LKLRKIPDSILKATKAQAIVEISRQEAWIYRDWQTAIGDLMLVKIHKAIRSYDIIGFGEFEKLFLEGKNIWLERVKSLFSNLNVGIDDRYDGRVVQLKNVYNCSFGLIEAYRKNFKGKVESIRPENFSKL